MPALVKWPKYVNPGAEYTTACSTLDYFPTIAEELGYSMPDDRPLDGVSLLPLLRNEMEERPSPIPLPVLEGKNAMFGSPTLALMGNRYKYLTNLSEDGAEDMMFDILEDPFETTNLIHDQKETADQMRGRLEGVHGLVQAQPLRSGLFGTLRTGE